MKIGETLARFIVKQQLKYAEARGDFTDLLIELTKAGKIIAREVNKAGLADNMGLTGNVNVHGEEVQKLDEFANITILKAAEQTGHLAAAASEEMDDIYLVQREYQGEYILVFDPVDGSSNIDVNVSIGTIFSIYRKKDSAVETSLVDFLRPGSEQLCAGYIIYGSSTMLVYTTGNGVHGFTLDPSLGEFLLTHENIRIPCRSKYYSVNESYRERWDPAMQAYVDFLKTEDAASGRPYSSRYIGSLVADFHRNLLKGGIFIYLSDRFLPEGKLRLLYEIAPLAFIANQAGGRASTGIEPIMDIQPQTLHQRVPVVIGSLDDVVQAESFIQGKRN